MAFTRAELLALASTAAVLGGCGQKGPLYLPDSAGTVVTRPVQTPAATPPNNTPPVPDPTKKDEDAAKKAAPAPKG